VPTSNWSFFAKEIIEPLNEGKQMTGLSKTGAPSTKVVNWKLINWTKIQHFVRRLQLRIAKAIKQGRHNKVKSLQWILTHSFYAKLLAIRRVTQNKGKNTPGVDRIIWRSSKQKIQAAKSLKRRGYHSLPLRRIYIPKKNGKLRPLGIPTMKDRAQQALHLLALEPVAEILADRNSYGFRPKRSIHDAIEQCFKILCRKTSPVYILEGDIKSCFDKMSHEWMKKNIPMDKLILKQWLKAGYMDKNGFHQTEKGTPQGGIASPTLANIALDGLEKNLKAISKQNEKANYIRYADDFICTAASKEILEKKVKPAIVNFLKERGLELSKEKTQITHIDEGFDFLGFNIRKYKSKLLIKPSKEGIKCFLNEIRETTKSNRSWSAVQLIQILNPKIRGWTNFYQHSVAKDTFRNIDKNIFCNIWSWLKRKHRNKNSSWLRSKYYTNIGTRRWCFFGIRKKEKKKNSKKEHCFLISAANTRIRRHLKIQAKATPYDPEYQEYFHKREI
jgi:RNA-directed DNA polymerase